MNQNKKKLLLRIGVIAMLVILAFTFVIVPALAATDVSSTANASSAQDAGALAVAPPSTGGSGSGTDAGSLPPPEQPGGTPYVTGYTVTVGNGTDELQRVTAGQKCAVIVTVYDPRITSDWYYVGKKPTGTDLKRPDGTDKVHVPTPNVKINTTSSFTPPTLGDIKANYTDKSLKKDGFVITMVFNDITYNGGDNKLGIDLSYSDNGRSLISLSQNISQCTDSAEVQGTPSSLLITNANYGTEGILAGKEFTLSATVRAAGGSAGAKNVSVALTLPEQITVASGSPNIFVGDIKPDTEKTISFKLVASAVANAGSYAVSITASGTASEGTAPSATMPVTVPITQPERFEISRFNLTEYMAMGEDNYATVSLVNKGKGAIYNVSAEITGEGLECPDGKVFIGNIAAGTENNTDITIRATSAGVHKAVLTVTYEDDKAVEKKLTKEVTITVEDNMGGNMGGDIGIMPPDMGTIGGDVEGIKKPGMPLWGWLLIILAIAGVGVAVFIILKKKKAKKLAEQLMEDDDEGI